MHPLDGAFDLNISSLKPLIMSEFCQAISMFKLQLLVTVIILANKEDSFQRTVNSVRGVQVRKRDNMKITLMFTKESKRQKKLSGYKANAN